MLATTRRLQRAGWGGHAGAGEDRAAGEEQDRPMIRQPRQCRLKRPEVLNRQLMKQHATEVFQPERRAPTEFVRRACPDGPEPGHLRAGRRQEQIMRRALCVPQRAADNGRERAATATKVAVRVVQRRTFGLVTGP